MANEIALLRKLIYFNEPSYLIFHVTARCNSKCQYCFNWKVCNTIDQKFELSFDDIEKIAKNLPYLMQLTLSGGEPTLRDDLPEICELFYRYSKIDLITLPTNALNPDRTVSIIEKIRRIAPKTHLRVVFTINGEKDLHDKFTGIPGSFEKVEEVIKNLEKIKNKDKYLTVDIVTLLMKENILEIPKTVKFVKEKLKINSHLLILLRGNVINPDSKSVDPEVYYSCSKMTNNTYTKNNNKPFYWLSNAISELNTEVVYKTINLKKAQLPCLAGKKLIVIDSFGNLKPCEYVDSVFGNLRENDFKIRELLKSSHANQIRKLISKTGCYCTWECSIQANIIYNPVVWPRIAFKILKAFSIQHSY